MATQGGEAAESERPSVVKLNVGGRHYVAAASTLTSQGGMLAAMLQGPYSSAELVDGAFFIDRDGEVFRYILEYLRCGMVEVPPTMPKGLLKKIEREADFFAFPGLVRYIRERLVEKRVRVSIFIGRFMCSNDGCNCGAGQKVEINEVEGLSFFDAEFIHPRQERRPAIGAPSCVLHILLQLQPSADSKGEAEGREGTGPVVLEPTDESMEQATSAIRHALLCSDEIGQSSADELVSDEWSPVRRALLDLAASGDLTFLQWLARADEYKVGDPNDERFQFVHYEKFVKLTFEVLPRPETCFGATSPRQPP
ncbi:KCTD21 [Symbiodinium natans]|uniref:KCTD21 protein n=1 Tax=Symbiodinium natans TaxID=878477 RepID=A0A812M4U2_9DINO|nr:KCTD21 [Symbiodinium natans]